MAITKTWTQATSAGRGYTLSLKVTESAVDLANNTSTVSWELKLLSGSSYGYSQFNTGFTVSIGGVTVASQTRDWSHQTTLARNSTLTLSSGSSTYTHGTDGTLSVACSAYLDISSDYPGPGETTLSGGTVALTSIPRESTIVGTSANIEEVSTLTVTQKNTSYKHSIQYTFGSITGYVTAAGGTSATEVKYKTTAIGFTLPATLYAQIPSATSGTLTLTIRTYYGSSQVGSAKTATLTATASYARCAPVIGTHSVVDINSDTVAVTGDSSIMVRGVSTARCTIAATARNSASLASNGLKINGRAVSSYLDIEDYALTSVTFWAKDTRGYETTYTATPELVAYVLLTNYSTATRPQPTDGSAKIQLRGKYWTGSFGASSNALTVRYRYRETGGTWGEWTTAAPAVSGTTYSQDVTFSAGFDYTKTYDIQVEASDLLLSLTTTILLAKGQPILEWGDDDVKANGSMQANSYTINGHYSAIGSIVEDVDGSVVSVSSDTYTAMASVSLTPGVWVVNGSLRFASNGTGSRAATINDTATWNSESAERVPASASSTTSICVSYIIVLDADKTLNLYAHQTSGSALNCYGWLRAVRII